jgi:hypothetical protein
MIHRLLPFDFDDILKVVNDAAQVYKGIIPADRWKEPYMPAEELRKEIADGVKFYGLKEGDVLLGVMGVQRVGDVTLIRHSYVLRSHQMKRIGKNLSTTSGDWRRPPRFWLAHGKQHGGL